MLSKQQLHDKKKKSGHSVFWPTLLYPIFYRKKSGPFALIIWIFESPQIMLMLILVSDLLLRLAYHRPSVLPPSPKLWTTISPSTTPPLLHSTFPPCTRRRLAAPSRSCLLLAILSWDKLLATLSFRLDFRKRLIYNDCTEISHKVPSDGY